MAFANVRLDWSFERKFEPAPATLQVLGTLCEGGELEALLFADDFDPRRRSTRLLLQMLAARSCLAFQERRLGDAPEEEERYGIGTSNSVILRYRADGRAQSEELVERPTEGALFEALLRCRRTRGRHALARDAAPAKASFASGEATGYSGLAAALATEGYALHQFVSPATLEIPDEVVAVLWLSPERALPAETLAALDRYLARGGRLVALLEPGVGERARGAARALGHRAAPAGW